MMYASVYVAMCSDLKKNTKLCSCPGGDKITPVTIDQWINKLSNEGGSIG